MESFIPTFNLIVGAGTVLMQVTALTVLLSLVVHRKKQNVLLDLISRHAYLIVFLVSAMSVVLSLVYSEVIGFAPCVLCWYQRTFMYPLAFIFGISLIKKEQIVTDYAIVLAIGGALVGIYQNLLAWLPSANLPCSATGPSCTMLYTNIFGYITIPVMALTGFIVVLLVLLVRKNRMKMVTTSHENA